MSSHRSLLGFAAALVLFPALAPAPAAQCFVFDGLGGNCCTSVSETLPPFPPISLPGTSICWDDCAVTNQTCTTVDLSSPAQLSCAEYESSFSYADCAGNALLAGTLHLDYTRSWQEFPVPGEQIQVWRFLVKADLAPQTSAASCEVPSCLGTHPTAFYYGYLDYAFNCVTATWEHALVLYHGCDRYQHDPAFSSRPGVFHPGRSYAIVAPSTGANPFVPTPLVPTDGSLFFEGMRDANPGGPPPFECEANEAMTGGTIANLVSLCGCPLSFNQIQTTLRRMDGTGLCGSEFRSINAFPVVPWFEVVTTSIGEWTTGATYPGTEAAWVDEGVFLHVEACTATGTVETWVEVKYGSTTERGYLATAGPALGDRFTDLVDNYSALLGTPILPPFFGSVEPSEHLIFVNAF